MKWVKIPKYTDSVFECGSDKEVFYTKKVSREKKWSAKEVLHM